MSQALRSMFFPSNIMFFSMSTDRSKDARLEDMIAIAVREKMGIAVYSQHPKNELDGDTMHTLTASVNTSCLFVKDSGDESMVV